jgi:hypothetical protein
MSVRLIERARQRMEEAAERLIKLQEELARVREEVTGWEEFIRKAELLASAQEDQSAATSLPNGYEVGMIHVKRDSLAGAAVRLIQEHGPLTLKQLTVHLIEMGKDAGIKDFPTAVNTALWRRREDLFAKGEDKRYQLRTREVQFVD